MHPDGTPTVRLLTARFSSGFGGSARRRSSPFAQGFTLLAVAIMLILLIPLVIIGIILAAAAGIAGFTYLTAKRTLARLRAPNGALDGRRNVRVRLPDRDNFDPNP
jgi:fatty acid desaturase